MSPVLHLKPGSIFAGDFRIVSPLNTGGMGAVYVADQLSTGFQRALKIMLPELLNDQELRDRFLREARVCARIQSDHVVQVVAAGIDQPTSTPWLAMELLRGEDLSEYIARRERVTPSGLVEIYRQLCHALGAAHAVGVVHRDLKPENIFLSVSKRAGAPFTVKVLDFGIAKMIADASAKMTALIGSPLWMAPEQMDPRSQISPTTDVWPLCLLAFWLLTGDHYWKSARIKPLSMHAIMREVLFDALPSASERAGELGLGDRIPAGFDEWFARCLVREPLQRIQTASEALEELERLLGIGPRGTMPYPPSHPSQEGQGPYDEIVDELSDANYEPPETVPPTLQSQTEEARAAPPPPSAPIQAVPVSSSSGPPTSMNGVVAPESARRSSTPSGVPLKSTAPLWMLAAGLVVLLIVIIIFVRQRTTAMHQTPPSPTSTSAPAPPPSLAPASSVTVPAATSAQVAAPPPTSPPTSSPSAAATPPSATAPATAAPPPGEPSFEGNKSFNPTAATAALKKAAASVNICKRNFGPTGPGIVKVTFGPSGSVTSALLMTPNYSGNLVGTCVANQFATIKIPPFEGTPVTTNMPFEIQP